MVIAKELFEITSKVISTIGEKAFQALFWELSSNGVPMNPEMFDLRTFNEELKKIFGNASELFMHEIYVRLRDDMVEHYGNNGEIAQIDDCDIAAIDKIARILAFRASM